MPINIRYQNPPFRLKNKKRIIHWILIVAYIEQRIIQNIDFVFCDDKFLLRLNKKYLSHHTLTDVITFDYSEGRKVNSEIYISIDRVEVNAQELNEVFENELHRVMIHGVLHCCGYKDKFLKDRIKMRKKEDHYLNLFSEIKNLD